MSAPALFTLAALVALIVVTMGPLGRYMAAVYGGREDGTAPGDRLFQPVERLIYRAARIDPDREQRWTAYALSVLAFSVASAAGLYGLLRLQGVLPLNPEGYDGVRPTIAFNTAVSFVTNTNWQSYGGESTMSHLSQALGLTVQNFVSAAVGMSVAAALVRGIARNRSGTIGSFWVDLVRTTVRILLPIALVAAVFFVTQGVIQNVDGFVRADTVEGVTQSIPGGPLASQLAIKQLGTNGGGFLNANSAHPFENPTPLSNLAETYLLLIIPFAFTVTYGVMVRDRRQGRVILGVMMGLWLATSLLAGFAETNGNPALDRIGVDQAVSSTQSGGNMEGKELRIGPGASGIFAASTTGTSTGAVNASHDSFTPLGGMVPMVNMMLGEVTPGGVGSGMVGMLLYAILAVFIAGLMVGRTPEYLGKKVQATEVKLIMLYLLAMPLALLGFAAASVVMGTATSSIGDAGPHGFSEVLYAFASAANNNGSAFGSLDATTDWYTTTLGLAMLVGRFLLIVPALAVAGSLARKQKVPATAGTFPTTSPLFGGLLTGVVLIVAGLTFFPALALGPIVEELSR
ncbi:MAG TPA: potassium-transporting ATPase subunit KdpA [Iamia sp.]